MGAPKFLGKSDNLILIDTGVVDLDNNTLYRCNPQSVIAHNPYFLENMPTEEEKEKVKGIVDKN